MKKITFFLFTVIMASSASAQSQNENRENAIAMDEQGNVNTMIVTNKPATDAASAVNRSSAVRRAAADGTSIIYDQPQGEVRYYAQNDSAYKAYLSWKAFGKEEGVVAKLVFDGDDVYYRNPVTTFLTGSWAKGKKSGDVISFAAKLPIYEQTNKDGSISTYYVTPMKKSVTWDSAKSKWNVTFIVDSAATDIKFKIDGNNITEVGEDMWGLVSSADEWTSYGTYYISLSLNEDKTVEAPEGLQYTDYSMKGKTASTGKIVKVAFNGSDVYIKGMCSNIPDALIKGSIVGDKVNVANGQFFGPDEKTNHYVYLMTARKDSVLNAKTNTYQYKYFLTDKITFDYDATTKSMESDSVIFINGEKTSLLYLETYENPVLKPFVEVAAIPADPKIISFKAYSSSMGFGQLLFSAKELDVDGNWINPELMAYEIYEDDEVLTFDKSTYTKISENMTEVPYMYTDSYDFLIASAGLRKVFLYDSGYDKIGVRMIYNGAGDKKMSNITYYIINATGISTTSTDASKEINSEAYYDMSGRSVGTPQHGIYIKKVTFSDGSSRSFKVME